MAIKTVQKKNTIAAREAKNRFGELLDRAQRTPITIEKKGRPVAFVLAGADYFGYKRFREMEDKVWGERATKAGKQGFLGVEASRKFLDQFRNA
jgi:prevent-host-death family protein